MNTEEGRRLIAEHEERLRNHSMILTDHEKRVRWLERAAFYALGAMFVLKVAWDIYVKSK